MAKTYMKTEHIKYSYHIEVLKKGPDSWVGKASGRKDYQGPSLGYAENFDIGETEAVTEEGCRQRLLELIESQKVFDNLELENMAQSYTEVIE